MLLTVSQMPEIVYRFVLEIYRQINYIPPLQRVVSAVEAGLDVSSLSANFTSRWDLASAFFFCGTIITTIGRWGLTFRLHFEDPTAIKCSLK